MLIIQRGVNVSTVKYQKLNLQARELLQEGKLIRKCTWANKEIEALNKHLLLTSKPVIYLINMGEKDYIKKKGKWLMKIKQVRF